MNRPLGCLWATILCAGVAAGSQEQGPGDARSGVTPQRAQLATPDALRSATPPRAPSPVALKSEATHAQTSIIATPSAVAPHQEASRAPANDNCANAYAFDLLAGQAITFSDDNTGATEDCPALSGGVYREVWYKFTTYETRDVAIKYCGTAPAFYNAYIVMDTTCPCSGSFIFASSWETSSCGDGNWTLNWIGLASGTYYWPLLTDSAGGPAEGPYTVTFEDVTPWWPPGPCPANTMYGQIPMDPGGAWGAYTSSVTSQFTYKCYENFFNLPDKIGDIHWWGLSLFFNPYYGWQLCDPTGMTFDIGFYLDAAGHPGTQVCSYTVAPTITDVGPFSWAELYYFSVSDLVPCCVLGNGWVSIQGQLHPADCAFLWLNSPTGDASSYQDQGGSLVQLGTDLAFCLTGGDCPQIFGACCDDYTGVCNDGVEWGNCMPPLRFTPDTLCADLTPLCGIRGACCDAGLNCIFTGFESQCDAVSGRFFPGQTCPAWACPADCEHRIDLKDCYGDGWNGNTLDVLVNGVTVLTGITLPSGTGPISFYFMAATGDTIQTIYYPIGGWPHEPYYYVYDGFGTLIGLDGIVGTDCYVQATGITCIGNCNPPTTGACCYFAGGCDMVPSAADCIDGVFLGLGHQCLECPCIVPCPPEGTPEPEPCGEDTDGGCNMATPTFAPIACGETICGTTWANPDLRDTDWYRVLATHAYQFTWTAEAQVPLLIFVIKPGSSYCDNLLILDSATAGECQVATISTNCLPPGEYWFWVGPSEWQDWPCEKNYTASLSCATCPPPPPPGGGALVCDEYISRVQIAEVDNPSDCGNTSNCFAIDYRDLTATLPVGIATVCTVTNGNPMWTADVCSIWIDWNHDGWWNDSPPELIGDITGVGPYVFNITPPAGAPYGTALMFIRLDYANSNPNPCGCTTYGEAEVYTVNVTEVPGACCWVNGTCTQELPSNCSGYWGDPYVQCANNDCNLNGDDDFCDIASGYSRDCDDNGIPDECQAFIDCNENGVADFCDIANCQGEAWCSDCNNNGIPDECDVPPYCQAGQPGFPEVCSLDCQPNGIPDECDITPGCGWQIDDGMSESTWGLPDAGELCWMNHMFAPSWEVVGHIAACFGSPSYPGSAGVVPGQPFRVYVWSDPNQDGNPLDAVFLGEATGAIEADSIDTDVVQMVTISPPIAVHGSFFIGASAHVPGGSPAPADDNGWTSPPDQAFLTFNSVPFDPSNITANLYPMSAFGYPLTVFLLRGMGPFSSDCNGNGVPDECDVPPPMGNCEGPDCSEDCQPNGIPDECEPDCQPNGRPDDCDIASGTSPDCNGNGIPDECDIADATSPDCNNNYIPDECDIAAGTSPDCNGNGVPDECDIANCPPGELWCCDCQGDGVPDGCQLWTGAPRDYLFWDDGSSENALGLTAGGELCWMVHFTDSVPGMCVARIEICFGTPSNPGSSGVSAGQPVRVYVWNDPNGDGNPNDAVFLGEASGTADGASIDSDSFQSIPLSPWVRVHSSFFVGASVVTTSGYPAPMDEDAPQYNEAWVTFNTVPFDPTNITAGLYNMTDIGYPCNWLLRAEIVCCSLPHDCNGNHIQDECDIGVQWGGYCATPGANCFPPECSSDWDHNGVPDECEVCGDLDNDGNVDLDDYWMFLDAFGTCVGDPKYNAAADMDGDGCVTLVDYQAWRLCYLMANGKEFVAPRPKAIAVPAKRAP